MSEGILVEAERLINGPRNASYGDVRDDYARIVALFGAWTGIELTVEQALRFMVCVKLSRDGYMFKRDNLVDACGYLALLEQCEAEPHVGPEELTYLASPYSHENPEIREERFQKAAWATSVLMRSGRMVFSPITHSHSVALHGTPSDWTFWQRFDFACLRSMKDMLILMLDGWEDSTGIGQEIEIMNQLGKPVEYISVAELEALEREIEKRG